MKILFVHDHIFVKKNSSVYSDKIPYVVLQRYISIFGKITVLARCRYDDNISGIPKSSGEDVDFIFKNSISSIKSYFGDRHKIKLELYDIIQKYDGVIVRLPSEYGFLVAEIAKKLHIPIAVEVVGCAWDAYWNYGSIKAKIYAPFVYIKMKKIVKHSNFVLYVTNSFLQRRYPSKKNACKVSVSNVELGQITPDIIKKRLRKIDNYTKKQIIKFGTIGSMKTKYKGIHFAIKALSEIKDYYKFEYHILGNGNIEYYKKLARKYNIEDRVFFDGLISSGTEVHKWLDEIDIYLQPSLQEGLPRALIEALSRGCPAIGSYAGGIPELISKELIINPKNCNKFKNTILSLLQNKNKLKIVAIKNINISKDYTKDILDKKRSDFWNCFYNSIIKEKK